MLCCVVLVLQQFFGGVDEAWFRLVHVAIEAAAAPAIAALRPLRAAAQEVGIMRCHWTLVRCHLFKSTSVDSPETVCDRADAKGVNMLRKLCCRAPMSVLLVLLLLLLGVGVCCRGMQLQWRRTCRLSLLA
jgi:hypothetical protein